jgi:putative redox protein
VKAVVESLGRVGSRARLGAHEMLFDQPAAVPGGEDRGPSPLDVMVVSVAACAHYFAAAYLHGRGFATEALSVEVDAEKERVPTSRVARLSLIVHLPAGLEDKHVAGVERAIKSCPAYGTLVHPPTVEMRVVPGAPPEQARQSA